MPTIRPLSQSMINKIAAGEVIERPASVVKELLENSLDAGSTRIDVAVEKGGTDMIRIVDNGCGIAKEQLILALSPHATSKVEATEDLFRIQTFGFRGEALASVAEISQLLLRSRTADSPEGAEIRSDGGTLSDPIPCGMPVGTTIEVGNLFFNTPVRRKYLRSLTTEFGHILETFIRIAIPHPEIHFTIRHNQKIVHELPAEPTGLERIGKLFGTEIAENLIFVESRRGDISVSGYVGHPKISRANNRMQYFFLNARPIRDRALQHALGEAFRGILTAGRFPIAFLRIEMAPELFDVNVHPTKMEVRFLDSNKIYSHFLGAIRERFLSVDLNSRITLKEEQGNSSHANEADPFFSEPPRSPYTAPTPRESNDPRNAMDDSLLEERRRKIVDWAKERLLEKERDKENVKTEPVRPDAQGLENRRQREPGTQSDPMEINRAFEESYAKEQQNWNASSFAPLPDVPQNPTKLGLYRLEEEANTKLNSREKPSVPSPSPSPVFSENTKISDPAAFNDPAAFSDSVAFNEESAPPVVQMHQRYLVVQTADGIGVIDQHALHERILYEKLKTRYESGKIETQRLLVPIPVDLAPVESACVAEHQDFFAGLGLQLEPFGGDTVLISGYPAVLAHVPPQDLLLGMIDTLLESSKKPDRTDLLEEMLHQMACKAAIKAGDRLRPDALAELLELAKNEANAHHCPHGRPSMLVFTCEELDKMFKRS